MTDLFEVNRYWSDDLVCHGNEADVQINSAETEDVELQTQEKDILKKLKSRAFKDNKPLSDVKTKTQTHDIPELEIKEFDVSEVLEKEKDHSTHGKKRKKRKRSKHIEKNEENSEVAKRGGFPILGENVRDQWKNKKIRRSLPSWLANPDVISVDLSDQQMPTDALKGLDSSTLDNLKKNNISHFFPVQRQVIPYLLSNDRTSIYPPHDICVSAPTGSGKTLAYVLPIVQALRRRIVPQIRALIILPVQDLASQVYRVVRQYCEGTSLKFKLLSGQKSFFQEQEELVKPDMVGGHHCLVDILVATPGRIVDHIRKTKGFSLKYLRYLVVDEADRIMEDIQNDWLTHVETCVYSDGRERPGPLSVAEVRKRKLPLQKLLYSATLSQNPEKLEKMNLFEPKLFTSIVQPKDIIKHEGEISVKNFQSGESSKEAVAGEFIGKYTTPAELTEIVVRCSDTLTKPLLLHHLLITKQMRKALVFTKSTDNSHNLAVMLRQFGLSVGEMSSKVHSKRSSIISNFTRGKIDVLVCTDALARGMDIGQIDYVISYDCPKFIKTYIHRVGRTARAGKHGYAITILSGKSEDKQFNNIMKEAGRGIDKMPTEEMVDQTKLNFDTYEKVKELTAKVLKEEKQNMLSNNRKRQNKI